MITILIASTTAALTSYFFQGQNVLYPFEIQEAFQLGDIHLYIILGGIAGIGSVHFSKIYTKISGIFEKINSWFKRLLIAGSLLGLLLFFLPSLYGEGYEEINMCLRGDYSYLFNNFLYESVADNTWLALGLMFLLVVFKSVATSLTFAAGGIGGIFAPSLFMGANMGLLAGLVLNMFGLSVSLSNFALVGMAGLVAGVIHAPLTAIFLIAELTGGHELFMPLMIVSTISYATVRIFEPHSVYTRQLAQSGELMTHRKDRNILLMMNVGELIEKDFTKIHLDDKLGDLVKTIKKSRRNIFPVVDDDNRFMGIVKLDDIRHIMFETEMYDKTSVKALMFMPENTIETNEQMEQVAKKFQESGRFNIVVLQDVKYLGFVSRAKVFSSYREMLKQFSDE
jgi:CIC family chloride channel protein